MPPDGSRSRSKERVSHASRKRAVRLGRNSPHRRPCSATWPPRCCAREIRTTLPKAKELRRVVEPLITLGKEDSVAQPPARVRRLRDRGVGKLFDELGPRFKARPAATCAS